MSEIRMRVHDFRRAGAIGESQARRNLGLPAAYYIRVALLLMLSTLAFVALSAAQDQNPTAKGTELLQGKLTVVAGDRPTLKTPSRDYSLSAKSSFLFHTLQDERLLNREIRVEGTAKPDGTFEVAHLFTIRDGKLCKLRYYCDVCNIAAQQPGNCVCCQRPTELQEIPLSEVGKDKDMVVVP